MRWKPHKSKEHTFLHESYTQKYFSAPKKNLRAEQKSCLEILVEYLILVRASFYPGLGRIFNLRRVCDFKLCP